MLCLSREHSCSPCPSGPVFTNAMCLFQHRHVHAQYTHVCTPSPRNVCTFYSVGEMRESKHREHSAPRKQSTFAVTLTLLEQRWQFTAFPAWCIWNAGITSGYKSRPCWLTGGLIPMGLPQSLPRSSWYKVLVPHSKCHSKGSSPHQTTRDIQTTLLWRKIIRFCFHISVLHAWLLKDIQIVFQLLHTLPVLFSD